MCALAAFSTCCHRMAVEASSTALWLIEPRALYSLPESLLQEVAYGCGACHVNFLLLCDQLPLTTCSSQHHQHATLMAAQYSRHASLTILLLPAMLSHDWEPAPSC